MTEPHSSTPAGSTAIIHKGCLVLEDYTNSWVVDYCEPGSFGALLGMHFTGDEEWWTHHCNQDALTAALFKYTGYRNAS